MWKFVLPAMLGLAACETTTAEGCPIYMTPEMQAYTQQCVATYHAEKARAAGQPVTRCFNTAGGVTCTTE